MDEGREGAQQGTSELDELKRWPGKGIAKRGLACRDRGDPGLWDVRLLYTWLSTSRLVLV